MAKIFITGSSEGLGLMAGQLLAQQGHTVVLHARNEKRAQDTRAALPDAQAVVVGDVSTLAAMRDVANQANALGRFDAVIHNVALGDQERRRIETADGLSALWAVNVLTPYVLTALMARPGRLVYLSSDMHLGGDPSLNDLQWATRRWNGSQAYSDSKLHDVLLAFSMARLWPAVPSNAVNPGWVPTRMGGPGATDDLHQAHLTQVWLAVGEDEGATTTGRYLFHKKPARLHPAARDHGLQDRLIDYCREVSGIAIPDPRSLVPDP
jgi:NAD(P)-dependent dehydrogenase (short-subunit alcohol dehydrogenase family)